MNEKWLHQILNRYTRDKAVIERVLQRCQGLTLEPGDPFTEYNLLILVLLEELRWLREGPVYEEIVLSYRQELQGKFNDLYRDLRRLFWQGMAYSTLMALIAVVVGIVLGKRLG